MKKTTTARTMKAPAPDFCDLVKLVPTATFVVMVSKAGLPVAEAKALCAAFKALKD